MPAIPSHFVSAIGTNAALVKASAGVVYGWQFANTTAAWKYVRIGNVATTPVPGTTAVYQTIGVPPNSTASEFHADGIAYGVGIGVWITGGAADADTTNTAANDVVGDLFWH